LLQDHFAPNQSNAVVLLGSIAGQLITGDQPAGYHAAKGALRQLARYYACSLGPKGIRVNCVSPGIVLKPEAESFYRLNKKLVALYAGICPLRRFGTAADVARVVRFLCSEDSAFITARTLWWMAVFRWCGRLPWLDNWFQLTSSNLLNLDGI